MDMQSGSGRLSRNKTELVSQLFLEVVGKTILSSEEDNTTLRNYWTEGESVLDFSQFIRPHEPAI
jgi:hypothetical protein